MLPEPLLLTPSASSLRLDEFRPNVACVLARRGQSACRVVSGFSPSDRARLALRPEKGYSKVIFASSITLE